MDSYRSVNWRVFRDEVIRLDGEHCVRCSRGLADGVILQVHHKLYVKGKKLWEYAYDQCETLCKGCHAEEHGKIPPKEGWECVGSDDLGDLIGTCDRCGTSIRYTFLVQHEKWDAMEVGELCCDNMTSTDDATKHMNEIRRANDRRRRFVCSKRWSVDPSGSFQIKQGDIRISIVPDGGKWRINMNGRLGKLIFLSVIDAKEKAFDLICSGAIESYFRQSKISCT